MMARRGYAGATLLQVMLASCAALVVAGCASTTGSGKALQARSVERSTVMHSPAVDRALEEQILALDPEHITDHDVRTTLAVGPTPRIILLHGSIYPASLIMTSFAGFLDGMGYPDSKLRDPQDGAYSQSPYGSSDRLAGEIAWYYEHDGVRPLIIGHSQGGMQAVKVLYKLAGAFSAQVAVWNPSTDKVEDRFTIIDPLTGAERPVVGLSVAYASALGAGGAAFVLPNQWEMFDRLHTIPNTVDEFTGYAISGDMVAWSFPGMSDASRYRRAGLAKVRNVVLPLTYNHAMVPITHRLATDAKARNWINAYVPGTSEEPGLPADVSGYNILWAADVWFSIKKHWCLEAQNLIRSRRAALDNGVVTSSVRQ
jgi:hypothetical protein